MLTPRKLIACLSLLVCSMLAGCGETGSNVKVYTVDGLVTFEGKPMTGGGSIAFVPVSAQRGKAAGGTIDKDGRYTLSTYGDGDGSMAGEFRVAITQEVAQMPTETVADGSGQAVKPGVMLPESERIPLYYSRDDKSTLTAKVEPKNGNVIDFKLTRR